MKNISFFIIVVLMQLMLFSCKEKNTDQKEQISLISVKTTSVKQGSIEKKVILNGKTVYLKKNNIAAPISAYVKTINVHFGDFVKKNDLLFELQTKESKALKSTVGNIKVFASSNGTIVSLLINQEGTYVSEGELLCSVVENKDVMIQMNVPYKYNKLLKRGINYKIILPDNSLMRAVISKILPMINETDQTQTVLLKPLGGKQLPENLNLLIEFILSKHDNSVLLDKQAVLTNEKQSNFWVMKIVNDSIAVKTPITKGIVNDSLIEILSGNLEANDLIITDGYGLPDSSLVKIVK
ncbi:MAG: HlyD family efflux transporter periplasmic adaptor subunit [Chlorobi bacterium]|nr:HlyD family efflux transporter periplasmic adaptor subunit [Chlorobiota bacterium]